MSAASTSCSEWSRGRALQDLADLVEAEARAALEQLAGVAVAEIYQEVRLGLAVGEEFGIDLGVVEARHRSAIEADRARRDDEIGALQRTVAERGGLGQASVAREPALGGLVVGKQPRQMLEELEIVG